MEMSQQSWWADRERWAAFILFYFIFFRGEFLQAGLCDRLAPRSGWGLVTPSLSSTPPRARQRGGSQVGVHVSVFPSGSGPRPGPHRSSLLLRLWGSRRPRDFRPPRLPSKVAPCVLRSGRLQSLL